MGRFHPTLLPILPRRRLWTPIRKGILSPTHRDRYRLLRRLVGQLPNPFRSFGHPADLSD